MPTPSMITYTRVGSLVFDSCCMMLCFVSQSLEGQSGIFNDLNRLYRQATFLVRQDESSEPPGSSAIPPVGYVRPSSTISANSTSTSISPSVSHLTFHAHQTRWCRPFRQSRRSQNPRPSCIMVVSPFWSSRLFSCGTRVYLSVFNTCLAFSQRSNILSHRHTEYYGTRYHHLCIGLHGGCKRS